MTNNSTIPQRERKKEVKGQHQQQVKDGGEKEAIFMELRSMDGEESNSECGKTQSCEAEDIRQIGCGLTGRLHGRTSTVKSEVNSVQGLGF